MGKENGGDIWEKEFYRHCDYLTIWKDIILPPQTFVFVIS